MNIVDYPRARQKDLVVQEMPGEVLVYDLASNKAHCLNETSATVWRACDGSTSVEEIVKEFEKNAGAKVTEDLVWLAIDQLSENGLLEAGITPRFAGQSRRDVLKKIGLASIVALPIVASLVAPKNAMAATSCTCNNSPQCTNKPPCPVTCNVGLGVCQ
jgi:hypothetical protein